MTAGASAVYSILVQWKVYEREAVSFYMGVPMESQENKIWGSHGQRVFISTLETKSRNRRHDNQPFVVWEQKEGKQESALANHVTEQLEIETAKRHNQFALETL